MASDVFVVALAGSLPLFMMVLSVLGQGPLYDYRDDIVILNNTNFVNLVHNSDSAWMVQFYNSWCGHCIRFAPTWKQLGTDIKGWNSVIQLGSIDCADTKNNAVCRNYDIKSFPTLTLFPAQADKNITGEIYLEGREIYVLRHQLIEYLESNKSGIHGIINKKLKNMKDLNEIWKKVEQHTQHIVIFIEESGSYVGREVILDVLKHKQLLVHRMVKPDVVKYGISKFPSMHLIEKEEEGKFTKLATNTDRKGFVRALLALIGIKEEEPEYLEGGGVGEVPVSTKPAPLSNDVLDKYGGRVHMQDLMSGLHYSLRQEVAGYKIIRDEAFEALKKYISILTKYFPGEKSVQIWLQNVNQELQGESQPLDVKKWLQILENAQGPKASLPTVMRWTGCAGSENKYRGYPCSLWTLFHTLTVNSVLKNGHERSFDPQEVLLTMRAYITNFFGCQECRENFYRGAVKIEKYVKTPNDSILFLWKSHNKANDRLAEDASEDPAHPKIQFPHKTLCPSCHVAGGNEGKDSWNEKQVLDFLIKMYSVESLVMDAKLEVEGDAYDYKDQLENINPKFKDALGRKRTSLPNQESTRMAARDEKIKKWKQQEFETRVRLTGDQGSGFSGIDLSICLMFYFVCSLIIIIVCFHFTVHKRMRLNVCSKY